MNDLQVGILYKAESNGELAEDSPDSVRELLCSCGHVTQMDRRELVVCPKCGNSNVIKIYPNKLDQSGDYPIVDQVFTCIYKDDKSFHLKREDVRITVQNQKINYKKTHEWEFKYNLVNRTVELTKDGKAIVGNRLTGYCNRFFNSRTPEFTLIDLFATEKNRGLYLFAFDVFGRMNYERNPMLGRALIRLIEFYGLSKLELFNNAGFGHLLKKLYKNRSIMISNETKPHKILGVPKYLLHFIKQLRSLSQYDLDTLVEMDKMFGGHNLKVVAQTFSEEASFSEMIQCASLLMELYNDYGYKDIIRLARYVTREVKLEQGISSPNVASTLLRDYVRMCHDMQMPPKEKYPKSLKKSHDIAHMNHSVKLSEVKNKQVAEITAEEDYKKLEYSNGGYSIVIPRDASDIISEGKSLSHCVASYVNDVIKKKCKILFLRHTERLDESLVTVEVRGDIIRQVKGESNRDPIRDELNFIKDWAEEKQLKLETY